MITPVMILDRARSLMAERGLCQGHHDTDGKCGGIQSSGHLSGVCIGTAIDDAYEELAQQFGWASVEHGHAESAVMLVTAAATPREFNDDPGTTLDDCLEVFDRASTMLREWYGKSGAPR